MAVIGGGFTGATLAAPLIRHSGPSVSIVDVEKSCLPGRGVAYGTECSSHLLNVPANDMSAFSEDREHFLRRAKSNYDRKTAAGSFLPRKEYGRDIGTMVSEAIRSGGGGCLHWKRDEARALSPVGDGRIEIRLRSGARILAEKVVFKIAYRKRKSGEESRLSVDRVINCTALETDCRRLRNPLVTSLLAQGLMRPDPLFLGLDTSADGALIDQDGMISDSLYAVGPLR